MPEHDIDRQIFQISLGLLARREHSQMELRQKLLARFPGHAKPVESALVKLRQDAYQSDERFAETYVRSRIAKGYGVLRLCQELKMRGISSEITAQVLAPYDNEEVALGRIHQVWQKKFARPPQDMLEKGRQTRFLLYRGFSQQDVNRLFQHLADSF